MKKQLIILLALALHVVSAAAFEGYAEIDGIRYYILTKGGYAEVAYKSDGYSGDIVIPSSIEYDGVTCAVTAIQNKAFWLESDLTSVSIPNTVTSIGVMAFEDCKKLETVNIPQSVTSLGNRAFYRCEGLKTVKADNVGSWCKMEIGQDANPLVYAQHLYFGDTEVIDLQISSTVDAVCGRAFHGYKGLKSVSFDSSVTSIGDYAFYECTELTTVNMPNSITEMGEYVFYGCKALTSLKLSENLIAINVGCFQGCTGLTRVSIPNSVTLIGLYAFRECSGLQKVYIGKGLTKIGMGAFSKCSELTDVYCAATSSPKIDAIFYSSNSLPFYNSHPEYSTLHVPEASVCEPL